MNTHSTDVNYMNLIIGLIQFALSKCELNESEK